MSDGSLLAIDLGTTRLKVAAFGLDGRLLALAARRHAEYRDGTRSWQSPDEWWADATALARQVLAEPEVARRPPLGLSLSGRGGAAVFTDAAGAVIEPPWSDSRHRAQLRQVLEWRNELELSSSGAALVAKALWLREQAPERFRRVRHVLYAKDYLLLRLTGAALTDWSSGPDSGAWDPELVARSKLEPALLPEPALPWHIAGTLTEAASAAIGCERKVPVAVGAHDGVCANVGAGAGLPGAWAVTLGTHGVVRAVASSAPQAARRFYGLPPGRHVIGGNAFLAGRALEWLLDGWSGASRDVRAEGFGELDAAAATLPPGAEGVRFLPFLGGQVAPEQRPEASAALLGLRLEHGRAHLWRAALEGTAFAIADIAEQVRSWCGPPRFVRLTGGGARSPIWSQILADVLDHRLELTGPAAEARGAAVFLAVGLGLHPDADTAAAAMVRVEDVRAPDPDRASAYAQVRSEWHRLAQAARSVRGA